MPWHIDAKHPGCSGFAVVQDSNNHVAGCHKTRAEAERQMAALYANVKESPLFAVKFVDSANWIIEGLALPYGGPLNGQDLTGTHFSAKTNFCLDWFPDPAARPLTYRHGFDPEIGVSVVGRGVALREDQHGRWLQAQIDKAHEYAAEIRQLVEDGLLSFSSGAVDHLVQIAAKSGEILLWPWAEEALVPNPANPEAVIYQIKSADAVSHIRILGHEIPTELQVKDTAGEGSTDEPQDAASLADGVEEPSDGVPSASADGVEPGELLVATLEATEPTLLEQLVGAVAMVREGRRNSTVDAAMLQAIHDATRDLGAMCAEGEKDVPVARVAQLAIIAGPAAPAQVDLDALKAQMAEHARSTAKHILQKE